MDNLFKDSPSQSTAELMMERFDIKTEVKTEHEDESVYSENEILPLIKMFPVESDVDHKESVNLHDIYVEKSESELIKNILPSNDLKTDVPQTNIQKNIVKEELEYFPNEEQDNGLEQDYDVEITQYHLKSEASNFNVENKIKTETFQEDGTIFEESDLNIDRPCLEKSEKTKSSSSCDYESRELNYKKVHKSNTKKDVQIHTGQGHFTCQICDKKLTRKRNLDSHIVSMHPENKQLMASISRKIHKCSMCEYKTLSTSCLKIHIQRHKSVATTEPAYQCDICGYKSIIKIDLQRHVQVHLVSEPRFFCRLCDKKFLRKRTLDYHILSWHSANNKMINTITSNIHKCDICEYKTLSRHSLIDHNLQIHESTETIQTYQCNVCNYKTIQKSNFKRHLEIHTSECRFQCQMCDRKFKLKQNLYRHVVSMHQEMIDNVPSKIFKCNICGYKSVSRSALQIHERTHKLDISERPFPCQICEKTYFRKIDLENHIVSVHSKNKKLMDSITRKINKCTMCEYKTILISSFKIHLRRHKSVPTYQCDICGHKTLVKKDLIRHIQMHTTEHSYLCRICDKRFLKKRSLDVHVVSRHSKNKEMMDDVTSKVYKCDMCEYKAVSSSKFKIHVLIHNRLNLEQQHC